MQTPKNRYRPGTGLFSTLIGLSPADIKADLRSASILQDGRVIFNIAGNKYRLVAWINYPYRVVYIRFIGTHAQYNAINPQTI